MNSADRALLNAFREISQMGDRLNLPKIVAVRKKIHFVAVQIMFSLNLHNGASHCFGDIAFMIDTKSCYITYSVYSHTFINDIS